MREHLLSELFLLGGRGGDRVLLGVRPGLGVFLQGAFAGAVPAGGQHGQFEPLGDADGRQHAAQGKAGRAALAAEAAGLPRDSAAQDRQSERGAFEQLFPARQSLAVTLRSAPQGHS